MLLTNILTWRLDQKLQGQMLIIIWHCFHNYFWPWPQPPEIGLGLGVLASFNITAECGLHHRSCSFTSEVQPPRVFVHVGFFRWALLRSWYAKLCVDKLDILLQRGKILCRAVSALRGRGLPRSSLIGVVYIQRGNCPKELRVRCRSV